MRFVTLPSVPITSTLRHAFDVMTSARRSGVVAANRQRTQYLLFSAADVVIAHSEHSAETLEQLKPTEILHVPSRLDVLRGIASSLPIEGHILEDSLDRANRQVGILADVENTALIVTRHEPISDVYDPAPSACYCNVDDKAVPVPPGADHGICPFAGYHGTSVRCMPKTGGI